MKAYLIAFNVASMAGWAFMLYQVIMHVTEGKTPKQFWDNYGMVLTLVQSAAIMEVIHAVIRLVKSSPLAVLMQVASRLVCVWLWPQFSTASQSHWSLYLMVASWSIVEVPRYAFYAFNLVQEQVPYPLFWLRYSLFAILYPTGITGELVQLWVSFPALKETSLALFYLGFIALVLYIPGSPFMYFHMMGQRNKSFKRRNQPKRPPAPIDGIQYPEDKKGKRSTLSFNKGTWEAAIKGVDNSIHAAIGKERNWRFKYNKHCVKSVRAAAANKEKCLTIAKQGLEHLHDTFEFYRNGKPTSLKTAMNTIKDTYYTYEIKGDKPKPSSYEYVVPYKNKNLTGDALLSQIKEWVEYGTIEPEAGKAIAACVENKEWLDLSDSYFVLLGAGSAMGPIQILLDHGANIIAVDLNRDFIWKRLIGLVRNSCGRMYFTTSKPADQIKNDEELFKVAGTNLFTNTPEIANWLSELLPGKRFIIGGYAYLDGPLFLKVSIAMDAIIAKVAENRGVETVGCAFLCSPTDCFVMPNAAHKAMEHNYAKATWWQKMFEMFGFLKKNAAPLVPATDSKNEFAVVDGYVVPQGPNYALAKRLQHWRCMLIREAGGWASSNIAPSTATASVVSNKSFAAAYGGMHHFQPMEVFYQETSNAVMGALLIHDYRNTQSVSYPSTKLNNPLELFASGSFHGGIWRIGYVFNGIGPISAVIYYVNEFKGVLAGVGAGLCGLGYVLVSKGAPHNWF